MFSMRCSCPFSQLHSLSGTAKRQTGAFSALHRSTKNGKKNAESPRQTSRPISVGSMSHDGIRAFTFVTVTSVFSSARGIPISPKPSHPLHRTAPRPDLLTPLHRRNTPYIPRLRRSGRRFPGCPDLHRRSGCQQMPKAG